MIMIHHGPASSDALSVIISNAAIKLSNQLKDGCLRRDSGLKRSQVCLFLLHV